VNDGVRYLEVRFSPVLHTADAHLRMAYSSVMNAICEGRELAHQKLPITVSIIVCGMRHLPPEVTYSLAEVCWRYRSQVCGDEGGFVTLFITVLCEVYMLINRVTHRA